MTTASDAMTRRRRLSAALLLLVVALAGAGVVSAQQAPAFPMTAERLATRVEAFWQAWQARDLHRVFLLYAPSYREGTSELAFYELTRGMLGITPIEYRLGPVELFPDGSRATVTLDAQTALAPVGRVRNKIVQHWVYEKGDWYRLMDPPSVPRMQPAAVDAVDRPARGEPGRTPAEGPAAPRTPAKP